MENAGARIDEDVAIRQDAARPIREVVPRGRIRGRSPGVSRRMEDGVVRRAADREESAIHELNLRPDLETAGIGEDDARASGRSPSLGRRVVELGVRNVLGIDDHDAAIGQEAEAFLGEGVGFTRGIHRRPGQGRGIEEGLAFRCDPALAEHENAIRLHHAG